MKKTLTSRDLPDLSLADVQLAQRTGGRLFVLGDPTPWRVTAVLGVYRGDTREGWRATVVADLDTHDDTG